MYVVPEAVAVLESGLVLLQLLQQAQPRADHNSLVLVIIRKNRFEGHCEHLQIVKNGGLTDILYMPYLYKSIVYGHNPWFYPLCKRSEVKGGRGGVDVMGI